MLAHEVTRYERGAHEAFVRTSWCLGAREPWETLSAKLRRPDVRCVVAHLPGEPDSLLGWACVDDAAGAVIWVYVRSLFGKARRKGVARSLLSRLGVDLSAPTPCLFWSPSAAEMAAAGKRIYYAPRGRGSKEAA